MFKPISSNNKPGWLSLEKYTRIFSSPDQLEDTAIKAAELYEQAANAFKNQKQSASTILVSDQSDDWHAGLESAYAYKRAAEAYVRAGDYSLVNAAARYENAWEEYMKTTEQDEGFSCLETAIQVSCASGKFDKAGRYGERLAAFLEEQNKSAQQQKLQPPYELQRIQEAYQRAGEFMEESSSSKK